MLDRIDLRSLGESIAEHAEYLSTLARDESVSDDVLYAETLGRVYLIDARLMRLRDSLAPAPRRPRIHHLRRLNECEEGGAA